MAPPRKRLDWWETEWRFPAPIDGHESQVARLREVTQAGKFSEDYTAQGFLHILLQSTKEIIFDIENDEPKFHFVNYALDAETLDLVLSASITISGIESDDILNLLAWTILYHIPLFPNTEEVLPKLLEYHRMLLTDGFTIKSDNGKLLRCELGSIIRPNFDQELKELLNSISPTQLLTQSNFQLLKESIFNRLQELQAAHGVLTNLELAIKELHEILQEETANENRLQECLTQNSILFGTEYCRVIPKHRLGSEFITDYALEKVSGVIDVVEIESSIHKLYTQQGNPSAALIHAEQQILDWLNWIEIESSYARRNLPGLQQPVGYIIIGRSTLLANKDRCKLNRRNTTYRGSIVILTYDDLLDRAKNLLNMLSSSHTAFNESEQE
jgi:hypothetical protein